MTPIIPNEGIVALFLLVTMAVGWAAYVTGLFVGRRQGIIHVKATIEAVRESVDKIIEGREKEKK